MTAPQALTLATATTWLAAPSKPTLRRMRVMVRTEANQRYEYEALFASNFDAYDNAMDRFPGALRIEVARLDIATPSPTQTLNNNPTQGDDGHAA